MAADRPAACAAAGTPGSNRAGGGRKVLPSIRTTSIIDPPVRNGGIASSSSARPYSTPIPNGPSILCEEKARKSAPSAATSTGGGGTDGAASPSTAAPYSA